jgi:hypothetical protein
LSKGGAASAAVTTGRHSITVQISNVGVTG